MKATTPLVLSLLAASIASTSLARAQAAGTMKQDAASKGKTDVGDGGFQAPTAKDDEGKDATEAQIAAGGMNSTGNARSTAITAAAKLRVRRDANQFSAAAAGNYSRAAADPASPTETTVENYQGKVRYDRFVYKNLALFLATTGRRDRFQGLDFRLNVDPGVAYYFIDEKKHQLWTELGYDLQYDIYRDENVAAAAAAGAPIDKTQLRHSGRLFAGYANSLNDAVTFNTGLEYLQAVPETEHWRLNWDVGLDAKVGGNFSLATTFSLKYDHAPLLGVMKTDTITAVSLVYQLL